MGLRIVTNVPSLAAQRTLGVNNRELSDSLGKLSSGSRINKAADDAAGLAISEKLKGTIRSLAQAERNANDGVSMIQTAEGGLNEISSILIRLRELAMQAASDTVGDQERTFTDIEYQNLKNEISRIAQVTEFNGKKLLNGQGDSYDFQIGVNNVDAEDRIKYNAADTDATLSSLGIESLDILSKQAAQNSLEVVDTAIGRISGQRANLGAIQNRLISTVNNLEVSMENLSAANSRIRDTDYASETARNAKYNILTTAGTAVLAQANASGQLALKLIG